jgi:two-component system, sensor histidine kinase ChiS
MVSEGHHLANGRDASVMRAGGEANLAQGQIGQAHTGRVHSNRTWTLIAATILMLSFAATANAGSVPACAAIDVRALPEVATCQRRFASALPDGLYDTADARMKSGDLKGAAVALGCAARQLIGKNDDLRQYEWVRRRGVLAYREERVADALGHFECALRMAEERGDRTATAKQLKNVGSALRRIGDYRSALRRLAESLALQRADGGDAVGPVLNNLGDIYRELNEPQTALRYYREALDDFRRSGNPVEAAHVLESLSVLALDRGDAREAAQLLESALAADLQNGNRPYRLRIYAGLIRLAIAENDLAKAQRWRSEGLSMAVDYGLTLPATLELEVARVDRLGGRRLGAQSRLRDAIARLPDNDTERPALQRELAANLEDEGDTSAAIEMLRQAHSAELRLAQSRYDRQSAWARSRFEAAEREHTIAGLEAENSLRSAALRQRTLLLWVTVASALLLLSLLLVFFLRRQHRARIAEAARQARHDEELARYRQHAAALDVDRRLLKALFEDRADPMCAIDADGAVLSSNRAACELLAVPEDAIAGRDFADYLQADQRDDFRAALERMEDATALPLTINRAQDGMPLRLTLTEWERDGGLILLGVAPASESPSTHEASAVVLSEVAEEAQAPAQQDFRRALVELMLAAIDIWERTTGQGRLEFAEKSRIWRVTIDDGRLRARAMERYLSVSRLPKNPRWRDVLRSAYFVLGQCEMKADARAELQREVDAVLAYTRRSALT